MTMQNTAVINPLKTVLAESVQLYVLTQNVHWNVTGPLFQPVHLLTEGQYTELAPAIDEIAERIRTLGAKAPGNMQAYMSLGSIEDCSEDASARDMIKSLVAGQNTLIGHLNDALNAAADANDEVTQGLLTDRLAVHEKSVWMLKAMLED
ncbi:DNA starvation/stationary phase protection protein [Kordiimonas sediminis]|uniref:DNA starvation/stationary phase protection protein n=1 Tax=Kordiimonas sediminis TaxID=1735581 RepID=A0A919AZM1_9PROT|nr:DNA starvation/stationary phase protection protein [Kordiimonas sediminis]GHF30324.1 DNA starvation/stationary phase protection protein [Kordiimonas sediminis]